MQVKFVYYGHRVKVKVRKYYHTGIISTRVASPLLTSSKTNGDVPTVIDLGAEPKVADLRVGEPRSGLKSGGPRVEDLGADRGCRSRVVHLTGTALRWLTYGGGPRVVDEGWWDYRQT